MMLRVNDEYLDFNDFVEVEKRVKLFERIEETLGDFSYAFNLAKTAKNMRILGNPMPDVRNKSIYQKVECDLLDDSGVTLYKGVLRVERIVKEIECAFFSGNYNWISLLGNPLSDLSLDDLDTPLLDGDIANSWDNTEGVIFPLIDTGALISRSYQSLMAEDFTGCIFVKTIFKRIFQEAGIKTNGDLFKDPVFNNLLLSRNTRSQDDIDNRSMYAKKTSNEVFTDPTNRVVLFQDDFTNPFFDGSQNNFVSSRYTADIKMKIRFEATIRYEDDSLVPGNREFGVSINGNFVNLKDLEATVAVSNPTFPTLTFSVSYIVTLEAGDYIEAFVQYNPAGSTAVLTIYEGSTIRITPVFIFLTPGKSLVPKWTQAQLVSNILAIFCCITDYEPVTKTLTIDFFEGIKNKEPLDLSEFLQINQTDYSEFISSFGKESLLAYQESEDEAVKEYNIAEFISYGAGKIDVDNDYIPDKATIIETDFAAPVSYLNTPFGASLERVEFTELTENGDQEFTQVVDSFGNARFEVADDSIYTVGELVRVSLSTNAGYNGEYVVQTVGGGTGFVILRGLSFTVDATGTITKLFHTATNNDSVYLLINTQYRVDNVSQYSNFSNYYIDANAYPNVGYAFFNLLDKGLPINTSYKQGLSFGSIQNVLSYQLSLVDTYWGQVSRVLNDPVQVKSIGHIPKVLFNRISPLRPVRIKTLETNNLYYLNRIGGYKASYLPCEVDTIKLS